MTLSWSDSYFGQLRALAGDRTLLLTATRIVARDPVGRILLIKRSDSGVWATPAGAMELGESISDCAVRELREETGLHATEVTAFAMHTGPQFTRRNLFGDTYQHFVVMFRADTWQGDLLRRTDESLDAGFFDPAEFPEPLSTTVTETLTDLDSFERTGRIVLR